ncbi:MAG: hypothetical protein ED557_10245 [Balneola sp.]|nr:MAG: hypothetical protein ED557_10245 [Balneola sp.]
MSKTLSILVFIVIPYLLAIDCEDDCMVIENVYLEESVSIISLSPLQGAYEAGDDVTLSISVPSSNNYFGESVNLFEETGEESATVIISLQIMI